MFVKFLKERKGKIIIWLIRDLLFVVKIVSVDIIFLMVCCFCLVDCFYFTKKVRIFKILFYKKYKLYL